MQECQRKEDGGARKYLISLLNNLFSQSTDTEYILGFWNKSMRRIWNDYKVWVLIGLAYTGFYLFKGYKNLKQIVSNLHKSLFLYSYYEHKKIK